MNRLNYNALCLLITLCNAYIKALSKVLAKVTVTSHELVFGAIALQYGWLS